ADRWQALSDVADVLFDRSQPRPLRPTPTPTGSSWEAEAGDITPPFVVENGFVYQPIYTGADILSSGKAIYRFTIDTSGEYLVKAVVDALDVNSNSLYLNIDTEPDLTMVWNAGITIGFEERFVARGDETSPRFFTLTAGEHELIIRGRDANLRIDRIGLEL